jgi:hypothetical protein
MRGSYILQQALRSLEWLAAAVSAHVVCEPFALSNTRQQCAAVTKILKNYFINVFSAASGLAGGAV